MGAEAGATNAALLFSDIEGSTRLAQRLGDRYPDLRETHRRLLRTAFVEHGGHEMGTEGDSFFIVFDRVDDAIAAAIDGQRALVAHDWPADAEIRVRMGIHCGAIAEHGGDLVGLAIHHARRIADAAHGGQVLVSDAVKNGAELRAPAAWQRLGPHRFKDIDEPLVVFQLEYPDLPSHFPPIRSLGAAPHNLPAELTSFIGRDRELKELRVTIGTTRLLTLTGAGGVGKTRLACRLGDAVQDSFRDGVRFVGLASVSDPELIETFVASGIGVREEAGTPLRNRIVDHLGPRNLLLVVDNAEHLLGEAATLVGELLAACPNLTVIVTSREPLGLAGEMTWRVPSLNEAVALFAERAALVEPGFSAALDAEHIEHICDRLDGIPLAIELAAAKVRILSCEQIAARLDDAFRLLTGGSRTALERHQTLRATVDWSYQLLDEPSQTLLRRLAVFAGGFTLDAAEQVGADDSLAATDVLDVLTALVDKSLVVVEGGRYRLLETIRQYAREKLFESGDAADLRQRHQRFYVRLAETTFDSVDGPQQNEVIARLWPEIDNIRAAQRWSLEERNAELALRFARAMGRIWLRYGPYSEGVRYVDEALALEGGGRPALRAWALLYSGALSSFMGADVAEYLPLAEEAVTIFRNTDDIVGLASALQNLSYRSLRVSGTTEDRTLALEALALAQGPDGDRTQEAFCLQTLGQMAQFDGDLAPARRYFEESLVVRRGAGDTRGVGESLACLGTAMLLGNDADAAQRFYEQALAIAEDTLDPELMAWTTHGLGACALVRDQIADAVDHLERSLEHQRTSGLGSFLARTLIDLGYVRIRLGDLDGARRAFDEARQHVQTARSLGDLERGCGEVALARRTPDEAQATLLRLWQRNSGDDYVNALVLEGLAGAESARGNPLNAARLLGAASTCRQRVAATHKTRVIDDERATAARAELTPVTFSAAWDAGAAMSPEAAIQSL